MGNHDELRGELEEIDQAIAGLPAESAARRHLEARRAELMAGLKDSSRPDTTSGGDDQTSGDPRAWVAGSSEAPPSGSSRVGRFAVAGLVAVVLLGAGIVWWNANFAAVPNVVNEERGYASGVLRSAGFEIEVVTEPDPDVAEGQVLNQEPEPGARHRTGEAVTLTVAELPTYDATGVFVLLASTDGPEDNCYGTGGYSDIRSGLAVTVRDSAGRTLATGRLSPGTRASLSRCIFEFEVWDIPQSDFYSFEVGRRGELTYSHREMETSGWDVSFELGR